MSTIGSGHCRTKFARLLGALVLALHAHAGAASNHLGADKPEGFGAGTTGGAGGEVVRVSTAKDLAYQLCRKAAGGVCADDVPRIIELATTIDFTGNARCQAGSLDVTQRMLA